MSGLDLRQWAERARAALARGDAYQYCQLAPVLAHHEPRNAEWIGGYVQSLATLGLGAVAGEILEGIARQNSGHPTVAKLRDTLRDVPSGRSAWSARKQSFERNVDRLAERDEHAADAVRETWSKRVRDFELHETRDGNFQVRDRSTSGVMRWWPGLADFRSSAAGAVNTDCVGILPPPLAFDGIGLGWDILSAYGKTHRVFLEASSAMYIIERVPEAAAIAFHLHDWSAMLADPRVQWFIGDDAGERFRDLIGSDASWPLTDRVRRMPALHETDGVSPVDALNAVVERRDHRRKALRVEVSQLYDRRDARFWLQRYVEAMDDEARATSKPLRILALTSLHTTFLQYSMRDCLRSLERLGHETRLLIEPAPHRYHDAIEALRVQHDFQPDLVMLLSRMRYEMPGLVHEAVPFVTWDQDALPFVFDRNRNPQLAWNDFLMGYAASTAHRRFGWPEHRLMYCPMAGSLDTYSADPIPESELEPFRCDVSYVSHASAPPDVELSHAESWLSEDRLRTLFRAVAPRVVPGWKAGGAFPGQVTSTIIDTAASHSMPLSAEDLSNVTLAICRVGDRAFRHVALQWVADWADRTGRTLHLWGHGWQNHPRLAKYAKGPTENGHALRCVYHASAINLQLMGYGFLHQRAFDGLMASSFFMARRSSADMQGPVLRELVRLLDEHGVTDASSLSQVTDPTVRQRIDELLYEHNSDPRALNPQEIGGWRANLPNAFADEIIPHFREISFNSSEEYAAGAERFLREPDTRRAYAAAMRETLVDRFSYDARMRDMLKFIRRGFEVEARGRREANRKSHRKDPVCAP